MSDRIGLFTGSFDPVTKGHVDLIERASTLFDQLYVGIFYNREKAGLFSLEERQRMLEKAIGHLDRVQVISSHQELAVQVAEKLGVKSLVRGIRNAQDLAYEADMSFFNRHLAPEIDTVFLLADPAYQHLSSSRVRELLAFGQDIGAYVPVSVMEEITHAKKETT